MTTITNTITPLIQGERHQHVKRGQGQTVLDIRAKRILLLFPPTRTIALPHWTSECMREIHYKSYYQFFNPLSLLGSEGGLTEEVEVYNAANLLLELLLSNSSLLEASSGFGINPLHSLKY